MLLIKKNDWSAGEQYHSAFVSTIIYHCTQASRPRLCLIPLDSEGKPRMIFMWDSDVTSICTQT